MHIKQILTSKGSNIFIYIFIRKLIIFGGLKKQTIIIYSLKFIRSLTLLITYI